MLVIQPFDERREIALPGDQQASIHFATKHWIGLAETAIAKRGRFAVALSGGSTPKAIYQELAKEHRHTLDWSKVWLFWSDERAVPPEASESNYHMAIEQLATLPIPHHQIFRMKAEESIQTNAKAYDALIREQLHTTLFDLVMLGVGDDGHTASLFPNTKALLVNNRLATENWVPEKNTWRMTLTFPCINQSQHISIYAFGSSKQSIVKKILESPFPSSWPAAHIGTRERKALWILDQEAAFLLI